MRRPVLTLLLLSSLTFFLGLGRQAITDSDEGFYAEAAREMVESGDWLTPHFNYSDRWQKPAFYYWLTAATYLVFGPTELAARLWSSLSGIGLVLLTWAIARRLGSRKQQGRTAGDRARDDTAWLAAAIVATCFGCFAMARLALPDLPLAFLITLAIWAALDDRPLVAGAVAGLGFLMKGPLARRDSGDRADPNLVARARLRRHPSEGHRRRGRAFALIGLPWYGAMTFEHGSAYLESFFVGDNLERFATDRFNAPRPLWFYLPIVIGGLLPWSMYAAILPWQSVRDVAWRRRPLTTEDWRLLAWAFIPLLFFTISIGKQPRYILPVLPPLGILLARSIVRRVHEVDRRSTENADRRHLGNGRAVRDSGHSSRSRLAALHHGVPAVDLRRHRADIRVRTRVGVARRRRGAGGSCRRRWPAAPPSCCCRCNLARWRAPEPNRSNGWPNSSACTAIQENRSASIRCS